MLNNRLEQLQREAYSGNVKAMTDLAIAYWQGDNCERDYKLAAEWAEKASRNGSITGMALAGIYFYMLGHSSLKIGAINENTIEKLQKGRYWTEEAMKHGHNKQEGNNRLAAIYDDLGDCYFVRKEYQMAYNCYSKTSTPKSALNIAIIAFGDTLNLSPSDDAFVFNKLIKAIPSDEIDREQNADGYWFLGIMFQHGIGTKQNTDEGYRCFSQSKQLGNMDAVGELKKYKKKLFGGYKYID